MAPRSPSATRPFLDLHAVLGEMLLKPLEVGRPHHHREMVQVRKTRTLSQRFADLHGKEVDHRVRADPHRWKPHFSSAKFVEPLRLQAKDVFVKGQRAVDVRHVEHDVVHRRDLEHVVSSSLSWPQRRVNLVASTAQRRRPPRSTVREWAGSIISRPPGPVSIFCSRTSTARGASNELIVVTSGPFTSQAVAAPLSAAPASTRVAGWARSRSRFTRATVSSRWCASVVATASTSPKGPRSATWWTRPPPPVSCAGGRS